METTYEFKIGQKVKMRDPDTEEMVYGIVVDKMRDSVFIKWVDLSAPCEHPRYDFPLIKLGL